MSVLTVKIVPIERKIILVSNANAKRATKKILKANAKGAICSEINVCWYVPTIQIRMKFSSPVKKNCLLLLTMYNSFTSVW